jgi:hypothetical protein
VNSVAQLGTEHVIDKAVLGDPGHAVKCIGGHHRVEVVTVTGHTGDGAWDPRLDP